MFDRFLGGWYVQSGGKAYGPFSRDTLGHMVAAGHISHDTRIRRRIGWWRQAERFPFLSASLASVNRVDGPGEVPETAAAPISTASLKAAVEKACRQPRAIVAVVVVVLVGIATAIGYHAGRPKPLDTVVLYASCRAAVATVIIRNDSAHDAAQGSGFFIAPSWATRYKGYNEGCCYLVTNYHVIRTATWGKVVLDGGREGLIHDVVMEDEDHDLAVLACTVFKGSIKSLGPGDFKRPDFRHSEPVATLVIAEGPEPLIGQRVYAIGSPRGLEASLSDGLISGKRDIGKGAWELQTTAPVSPGSSGGPLLNPDGTVAGVIAAGLRGAQNANFAVPAALVIRFLRGPCNSRELWRGRGIDEEVWAACHLADKDLVVARAEGRVRVLFTEVKSDAYKAIGEDDHAFAERLRPLRTASPSEFGQHEYLLYYMIGLTAAAKAGEIRMPFITPATQAWLDANSEDSEELRQWKMQNRKTHQLAMASLVKSLELKPGFAPALLQWAFCLACEGRLDDALRVVNDVVRLVPYSAQSHIARGNLYKFMNRRSEALVDLDSAAELDPSDANIREQIGMLCEDTGDIAKALAAYGEGAALGEPLFSGDCFFKMGKLYKRLGQFEKAIACFEAVLADGTLRYTYVCRKGIADCQRELNKNPQ